MGVPTQGLPLWASAGLTRGLPACGCPCHTCAPRTCRCPKELVGCGVPPHPLSRGPGALRHFWSLQATGRSATPGRKRNNSSRPGLWAVRPPETEADCSVVGGAPGCPAPCSVRHPGTTLLVHLTVVLVTGAQRAPPTPHAREQGSSSPRSPLLHFSDALVLLNPTLPLNPGLASASPPLHLWT